MRSGPLLMAVETICLPVIPFTISMLAGFNCSFHSTCNEVVAGFGNKRTFGASINEIDERLVCAFVANPAAKQKIDMKSNFRNESKLDLFSQKKNTGAQAPVTTLTSLSN